MDITLLAAIKQKISLAMNSNLAVGDGMCCLRNSFCGCQLEIYVV